MNDPVQPQAVAAPPAARRGRQVVLGGVGAIGAPLCDMLSRCETIARLTLVDMDVYSTGNLRGQAGVGREDVGVPKVFAQGRKARALRPDLIVEALFSRLEDVPMGWLRRADLLLTAFDSKAARREANQRAWWAGVPWIDAGVKAQEGLVRVSVFMPGVNQPCLECAWDAQDYETLEVRQPCLNELPTGPTGAPAWLGAVAAALQMAEAESLLAADPARPEAGKELMLAVRSHKLYVTTLRRFSGCRFDHQTCPVRPLGCSAFRSSLGDLLSALGRELPAVRPLRFEVPGLAFVRQLKCGCGAEKEAFHLDRRFAPSLLACPRCGAQMAPVGFSMLPEVAGEDLPPAARDWPLRAAGFLPGDWVRVRTEGGRLAFEIEANGATP